MIVSAGRINITPYKSGQFLRPDPKLFPEKVHTEQSRAVIEFLREETKKLQKLELGLTQMRLNELNKLMHLQAKLVSGFNDGKIRALKHDAMFIGKSLQNIGQHLEQIISRDNSLQNDSQNPNIGARKILDNYQETAVNFTDFTALSYTV